MYLLVGLQYYVVLPISGCGEVHGDQRLRKTGSGIRMYIAYTSCRAAIADFIACVYM